MLKNNSPGRSTTMHVKYRVTLAGRSLDCFIFLRRGYYETFEFRDRNMIVERH